MRFTTKFTRRVGGTTAFPILGSDATPVGPPPQRDNIMDQVFSNISGWPAHRLVVGYKYEGVLVPLNLPASLYLWEDETEAWYLVPQPAAVLLKPGQLSFFDIVGLLNPPQLGAGSNGSAGALNAYLKVSAAGADPAGLYTFPMASDLTSLAV